MCIRDRCPRAQGGESDRGSARSQPPSGPTRATPGESSSSVEGTAAFRRTYSHCSMTRPRQLGLWAGLIAMKTVIAHLPSFFHRLLDGDEAVYGSIAALMNAGGQLYGAGGVDNKPPGIFWVYAAIFRVAGNYQMTAVHAVGFVVIAATCYLLFVIGRDLGGFRTGLLAALFYGVLTAAGNPRLLATNTEMFMMLPLVASVLLMLRRRWFWSGCLLVAAGAFRQVAAVNVLLAVAGIFWLESSDNRRRAAAWFAG